QGFDPDFIFTWPTGRMGVMEGDSAVMALFSAEIHGFEKPGQKPTLPRNKEWTECRQVNEKELNPGNPRARGFVDAILTPENTRPALKLALATALNNPGPHLGPFVLPWNCQ